MTSGTISMPSFNGSKLPMQAEKLLSHTIRPYLLAYCSRTDLLAVVNNEEVIDVYRLSGQRAFSVKRKSPSSRVVGLEWIRDGKCLAVALSTGYVDIVSGETGKIVRHGGDDPFTNDASASQRTPTAITCLGWGTTLTGNSKTITKTSKNTPQSDGRSKDEPTTEDWYEEMQGDATGGLPEDDAKARDPKSREAMMDDLPRQLAFIDVESILPRLSFIPARASTGGRYDMFITQPALDDYFNSLRRKDRQVADIMLVGHEDGRVRLVVDDILEVGLPAEGTRKSSGPIKAQLRYASHPQSPYHALLRADRDNSETNTEATTYQNLSLNLLDIPLLSSGGSHLHLIVSRTAQIRDLCSYITYSILCAKADWTTHTNLPSRFMENINETLEEKQEGTLEQNLFHLAMTGNFTPTILEWLRDELAERGHKRWDHATSTLHNDLSKLLQTNLLPVLERCIVVATTLRGLASYYEGSTKFDVPPSFFTAIIDALCMLQLLVHEAIQILGAEQRQFRAFSKWLRHVIDLSAANPDSVSAKDMAEREAGNLEISLVLAYLEGALTQSKLKPIIAAVTDNGEIGEISQAEVIKAIHQARNGDAGRASLLSLHTLSTHLNTVCRAAHAQILRWQNSASPTVEDVKLTVDAVTGVYDMKMICVSPNHFTTLVLTVPQDAQHTISFTTISHSTSNTTQYHPQTHHQLRFPTSSRVIALKILDETTVLALVSQTTSAHLLHLRYAPLSADPTACIPDTGDEKGLERYIIHSFPAAEGFVPVEMVVSGKEGGKIVLVVGEGHRGWRIYDLESADRMHDDGRGEEAEGEDEGEDRLEDGMVID